MTAVPLTELICLFAGQRVPEDQQPANTAWQWATEPTYSIPLIVEICRRTDPNSIEALRRTVYPTCQVIDLDDDALEALKLGYDRYRTIRQGRGL